MRWSHLNGKNENILEHICVIRVHSVFHGIRLSQITPLLLVRENREGTKINNPPAVYASGLFFCSLVKDPKSLFLLQEIPVDLLDKLLTG